MSELKITVLIENSSRNELLCEHGLSFYIEYHQHHYLLDAGQSDAFMQNAAKLNIDLSKIKYAILSHGHYDHGNGFLPFQEQYLKPIYMMETGMNQYYSNSKGNLREIGLIEDIIKRYEHTFILLSDLTEIDDFYLLPHSTKMLSCIGSKAGLFKVKADNIVPDDFEHELSVVFKTKKGLVIINSCSHAGLENIVEEVKRAFPQEKIYAYIGGLHLKKMINKEETCLYNTDEMNHLCNYIKENDIKKIYTGHCTGSVAYDLLSEQLKDIIQPLFSGCVIEVE